MLGKNALLAVSYACENISEGRCDHRFGRIELAFGVSLEIALSTRADA